MTKQAGLFRVQNSDWIIRETESGKYELSTADGLKKIGGLTAKSCAAAQGVFAELDRYIKEKGGV